MTARALSEAGYATLEAEDGQAALDLIAGGSRLDLVVTDLGMPRMDGAELARRLRADLPGLPVLLISGHVHEDPGGDGEQWPLLRKPYPPEELVRRVTEVLAASRSRRGPPSTPGWGSVAAPPSRAS